MQEELNPYKDKIESLSEQDWQTLLDLIPEIEKTESFGRVAESPGQFPHYVPEEIVNIFFEIVHRIGIIIPFDWTRWETGRLILKDKDFDFSTISLIDKCKVITMLIRLDRFSEGTFVEAFESGLILNLLKSIKIDIKKK